MPDQAQIAAPTMTLAAAKPFSRCDSRGVDVTVVAAGDANDDENLVALRIHTDVHSWRMRRSNTFVHEAPRPGEYWIRKLRPSHTRLHRTEYNLRPQPRRVCFRPALAGWQRFPYHFVTAWSN